MSPPGHHDPDGCVAHTLARCPGIDIRRLGRVLRREARDGEGGIEREELCRPLLASISVRLNQCMGLLPAETLSGHSWVGVERRALRPRRLVCDLHHLWENPGLCG